MIENRIKTLNTIDNSKEWEDILFNNVKSYESYKDLLGNENYDEAQKKLCKLLPDYFNVFKLINKNNTDKEQLKIASNPYDAGIFLVGYSIMPLILSISQIKPNKIIFIVTEDTKNLIDEIKIGIKAVNNTYYDQIESASTDEIIIGDLSDPAKVFQIIDRIIDKNYEKNIAIDITGGKKTMVAGAFMASAHSRACDIFYIDFEQYDSKKSEPVYGTEFLANLPNPSEIFSLADWDRLISLQDNYQFKQALIEINKIKIKIKKYEKYFSYKFSEKLDALENQIKGFDFWDDCRYDKAFTYLPDNPALKVLKTIPELPVENSRDSKKIIYNDSKLLGYYLMDRLENSRRRKRQGQYQNAFLGFASLIEFIIMMWAENELTCQQQNSLKTSEYLTYNNVLHFLQNNPCDIGENSIDINNLKQLKWLRNNHALIHSIKVIGSEVTGNADNQAFQIIKNLLMKIKNFDFHYVQACQNDVVFQFGE